ncbi:MAG TPA: hypothetical protein VF505_07970, partial [Thermoanaerobaculia bacterium]
MAGRRVDEVIALATSQEWSAVSPDDAPLVPELKKIGLAARPVVWSDANVDWRTFDLVVIRSCWDYHLRVDEFSAWIDRLVREGVPVFNPPPVLRWNMIVKPAVSASASSDASLRGDVIVQEFVHEIVDDGEWSLVFLDRRFSHAVKKSPKS